MIAPLTVRMVGLALGYLLTVVCTRLLGAEGFGLFATGLSIAAILATIAAFGLPTMATRDLARLEPGPERAAFVRAAVVLLALASGTILLLGAVGAALSSGFAQTALLTGLVVFPLTALIRLRQGIAVPLQGATQAILPEQIILPALAIAGIAASDLIGEPGIATAVAIYCCAASVAVAVGTLSLSTQIPMVRNPIGSPSATIRRSPLRTIREAHPFLLAELPNAFTVNIDIVIVSALLGAHAAGLYVVATRLANLAMLPVTIVNFTYMPIFSRCHSQSDYGQLMRAVREASFFSLLGGGAIAAAVALAFPIVAGLFGSEFDKAHTAFCVLATVRVVTCAFSANESLLLMTGREQSAVRFAWIRAAVLGSFTTLGALGGSLLTATAGTALAIFCINLSVALFMWRNHRVYAYPLITWNELKAPIFSKS